MPVLNIIYDDRNSLRAPRISVILEFAAEADRFHDGINFDRDKQSAIAARFRELVSGGPYDFDLNGLFVVFVAFAPVAIIEANDSVSKKDVRALESRLGDSALWCIARSFASVTFMFYTDAQRREREQDGSKDVYARAYFELVKPHDQFNYLEDSKYPVMFDSKETFDRDYNGSWFLYFR